MLAPPMLLVVFLALFLLVCILPLFSHLWLKERSTCAKNKKSNSLLDTVFPKFIIAKLKTGTHIIPKHYSCVTIFFCDIVGFTDYTTCLTPTQIVCMLDRLYGDFDKLAEIHELFKVETIGDSYMVCGAIADGQSSDHACRVAAFALDAVQTSRKTLVDLESPHLGCVQIRAGFHCGPVLGGVVGRSVPRFCLFGDTVTIAARMEQCSEASQITVSNEAAKLLRLQSSTCVLLPRQFVEVKGKGPMKLWWLLKASEPCSHIALSSQQIWRRNLELDHDGSLLSTLLQKTPPSPPSPKSPFMRRQSVDKAASPRISEKRTSVPNMGGHFKD